MNDASDCPNIDDWSGSSLFEGSTGKLAEFCVYEWTGLGAPDVVGLNNNAGVVAAAADCEAVLQQSNGPTTDAMWDVVGDEVVELFHYGVGRASATDLALPSSESSRWPVIVAVIDTVPHPLPAEPRSEHGELVISIIDAIACPNSGASCKVSTMPALGLPRYKIGEVDRINGGIFGSQVDVAQPIYEVVNQWASHNWGATKPNLVLNLSFAWEGELFGDTDDGDVRPAVAAVHAAIEYASCHGALVVAAAGNEGFPCTEGPLLPAAWEREPAPDAGRCADLGAPARPPSVGYQPLVYSVGGLTYQQEPMPGTRLSGRPRLAALATHVSAGDDSTSLTGTSVAAAVVSGAAALVWSYNHQLPAPAIMAALYQSGDPLTWNADYLLAGASNSAAKAVNACAALELACNLPGSSCPATPFATPLACLNATPPNYDDMFAEIAAVPADHYVSRSFGPTPTTCYACAVETGYGYLANLFPSGASPCPVEVEQTLPFTLPQPIQVGCSNCTFDPGSYIVYASLDVAYEGQAVLDLTVSLSDGTDTYSYRYGAVPLAVDEITQIQVEPRPTTVEAAKISLTFQDSKLGTVVDPLLIR